MSVYDYELWSSRAGQGWINGTVRGITKWDLIDYHVDLGCGTVPKARIGIDRYPAPGVAVVARLDGPDGPSTVGHPREPNQDAKPFGGLPMTPDWHERDGRNGLPFEDSSIQSIISHHALEHVGTGFIPLIDELYRVLVPNGTLYAITPLFPSTSAVQDPDHSRYFMATENHCTWDAFCADEDKNISSESFSVPYTKARFRKVHQDYTPQLAEPWSELDHRELRCALEAIK